ncbi:MAG: hypothetical protein M1831_006175 [Alyxoria varia]|nr:MAG: hypothetical protein M1831_006175 [Alyxoria varia]
MHDDLRRRALESKKTVSRKAKAKVDTNLSSGVSSPVGSRPNSAANSRAASRAGSAQPSDDEGSDSDETSFSMTSLDAALHGDTQGFTNQSWSDELSRRVENILGARKRRRLEEREQDLGLYTGILRHHFAADEIYSNLRNLCGAFLKAAGIEETQREAISALKALEITVLTDKSEDPFELCGQELKRFIERSEDQTVQAETIRALAIVTFLGAAGTDDLESTMDFFLEISESDGYNISADDSAEVVTAALESCSLLATEIDDLSDRSDEIVEAVMEQLESADPAVQVAAGEFIALLYEKSWRPTDPDEDEDIPEDVHTGIAASHLEAYPAYRRKDQLLSKLTALAKESSRSRSKTTRKTLHTNFSDIRQSVELPFVGPRYSNAIDQETSRKYGSKMAIRVDPQRKMIIDSWWKLSRLRMLQHVLGSGFMEHYELNDVVLETLPTSKDSFKEDNHQLKSNNGSPRFKQRQVVGFEDD